MPPPPSTRYRNPIFVLQLIYLVVLALLAWGYNAGRLPEPLRAIPDPIGSMPLAVPWFGALGGVLISLAGIHQHRYDWDPQYWSWHIVRPLVGAAVAVVAVMIVQAGILATGVDPKDNADAGTKNTFYYLVAFIAGYREATFRGMVKRLADAILTAPEEGLPPRVVDVDPPEGPVDGGIPVKIKGGGFAGAEVVTFGLTQSPSIRVASDAEIVAEVPPGTAGPTTVSVMTPRGSASKTDAFTYVP